MANNEKLMAEKTRTLHALLTSESLEASESKETIEELNSMLTEMGLHIEEVNASIEFIRKKFAGKWAMKQACMRRRGRQDRKTTDVIQFPDTRKEIEAEIFNLQEELSSEFATAARRTCEADDQELRLILKDLRPLKQKRDNKGETEN